MENTTSISVVNDSLHYLYAIYKSGGPAVDDYPSVTECFNIIMESYKNRTIGKDVLDDFRDKIKDAWLTPYTMQGFAAIKPNGYAGCYETIERIYTRWHSPISSLLRWDEYFHSHPASNAVRNRANVLKDVIERSGRESTLRILNLGCGPGMEFIASFFEHYKKIDVVDFVDIDKNAIKRCAVNLSEYTDKINFIHKNVLRFRSDQKYDLIWSSGLFDYLNDTIFRSMLKRLGRMLNDDGRIVIGNFSPVNPSRNYMELVEWEIIHRSEKDLVTIAELSGAHDINVFSDPSGVNLFLNISKFELN